MVVAVVLVRVVQVALDEVIDVVAVRHRLVAAAGPMLVLCVMSRLVGEVATPVGIRLANGKGVFRNRVALLMTKMTILQEIDVAIVFNRGMTAARTV